MTGRRSRLQHLLSGNTSVVHEIHCPTTDLTCAACSLPWPCPPWSAAEAHLARRTSPHPLATAAHRTTN